MTIDRASLHASLSSSGADSMVFLNSVADRYPNAISFAAGRPSDHLLDLADVDRHLKRFVRHAVDVRGSSVEEVTREVMQYGDTSGTIRGPLAEMLARDEGVHVSVESVVVTTGFQEALLITLRALFRDPEDVLLITSPCYVGVTGAAALLGIEVHTVPERLDGLDPQDVARIADRVRRSGRRPRALYIVSDTSNPSGNSLSEQSRRDLLGVAKAYGLLLLEDQAYSVFAGKERIPCLKSLDKDQRVIYLGSLAKSGFPGLRIGFVVADQWVTDPNGRGHTLAADLARVKSMVTVNTSGVTQAVAGGMLLEHGGSLRARNEAAFDFYQSNLHALLDCLEARFGPGRTVLPTWNRPVGGFFVVLNVPFEADTVALGRSARDHGVIWTPMRFFHPDGGGTRQLRLSISSLSPSRLLEGARRLCDFVEVCSSTRPTSPGWRSPYTFADNPDIKELG